MRRHPNKSSLFLSLILYGLQRMVVDACIGGGGSSGGACCPIASSACAPSVPVCSNYGYSSYSAGGSYAAPQASYPRPISYSSPCSSGGCGASAPVQSSAPCPSSGSSGCGSSPPIAIIVPSVGQASSYPSGPSYASAPIGGYARAVAPSYSAPLPAAPLPPTPYNAPSAPQPSSYNPASSYGGQIPQAGQEEGNYEDQHVAPPAPNYGEQPTQIAPSSAPYGEENTAAPPPTDFNANEGKQNYDNIPASEATNQQSTKPNYDNQHDYADETNTIGGSEPASVVPSPSKPDADEASAVNCEDEELRKIVENALQQSQDNLDAARKIESEAAAKFGGRFNSIVSNSEFAYVNWYGKRNCQLRVNNTHSLTWED